MIRKLIDLQGNPRMHLPALHARDIRVKHHKQKQQKRHAQLHCISKFIRFYDIIHSYHSACLWGHPVKKMLLTIWDNLLFIHLFSCMFSLELCYLLLVVTTHACCAWYEWYFNLASIELNKLSEFSHY